MGKLFIYYYWVLLISSKTMTQHDYQQELLQGIPRLIPGKPKTVETKNWSFNDANWGDSWLECSYRGRACKPWPARSMLTNVCSCFMHVSASTAPNRPLFLKIFGIMQVKKKTVFQTGISKTGLTTDDKGGWISGISDPVLASSWAKRYKTHFRASRNYACHECTPTRCTRSRRTNFCLARFRL